MLRASVRTGQTACPRTAPEGECQSYRPWRPGRASGDLAGKFPEIRDCTSSHTQSGTLSLPLRFIPSGTSGKMERAPLQAARKVVTVLVVEDDWMIRENLVTDLQQEGWAVLEAATGAGALQSLQDAEKVDLLITDIGLADALSGWDVAEAFRIAHPEISGDLCVRKSRERSSPSRGERLSQ